MSNSIESAGEREAVITGTGHYLPGDPVTSDFITELWPSLPVETAMQYFGVEQRHLVIDPATGQRSTVEVNGQEVPLGTTEMAARACTAALEAAGVEPEEVDLVITNSTTPDATLPPFTLLLQRRLGLGEAQLIDLRGGCAAAIQALTIAAMMIRNGRARTALLTGAECTSPYYFRKLLDDQQQASMDDILNGLLFADGAGAMVIQERSVAQPATGSALRVGHTDTRSCFAGEKLGFELLPKDGGGIETRHNHRAIRRTLPKVVARAYEELSSNGRSAFDGYDLLVIPQVNRSMIEMVTGGVETETIDHLFYIGHETGNVPAAAMLMALDFAIRRDRVVAGSAIGVLSAETTSWTYAVAELKECSQS